MKRLIIIMSVVLAVLMLTACGSRRKQTQSVTHSPTVSATAVPTTVPIPAPTTPMVTPPPSTVAPTATAVPTPSQTPVPAPTPTPPLPVITKSPTDEIVEEGGSCYFVAKYENATIAVWHFISPDGQTDMTYTAAQEKFPTMEIINGMYSTMQLKNIPYEANGWRVYCRYSNNNGYSDTKTALISVIANPNPTPTPTPTPVGFNGKWAEKYSHRGVITMNGQNGQYSVEVEWSSSAFESVLWTMTARDNGFGVLLYSDCIKVLQTYQNDGSYSLDTEYTNGSGAFMMNGNGEVLWEDDMGDVPYDTCFVRAG